MWYWLLLTILILLLVVWLGRNVVGIEGYDSFDIVFMTIFVGLTIGRIAYFIVNLNEYNLSGWSVSPYYFIPGGSRIWLEQMPWNILRFSDGGISFFWFIFGSLLGAYIGVIFKKIKNIKRHVSLILIGVLFSITIFWGMLIIMVNRGSWIPIGIRKDIFFDQSARLGYLSGIMAVMGVFLFVSLLLFKKRFFEKLVQLFILSIAVCIVFVILLNSTFDYALSNRLDLIILVGVLLVVDVWIFLNSLLGSTGQLQENGVKVSSDRKNPVLGRSVSGFSREYKRSFKSERNERLFYNLRVKLYSLFRRVSKRDV